MGQKLSRSVSWAFGTGKTGGKSSNDSPCGKTGFAVAGASPFVLTRKGSMFLDQDGDVAHEFYEQELVKMCLNKRGTPSPSPPPPHGDAFQPPPQSTPTPPAEDPPPSPSPHSFQSDPLSDFFGLGPNELWRYLILLLFLCVIVLGLCVVVMFLITVVLGLMMLILSAMSELGLMVLG